MGERGRKGGKVRSREGGREGDRRDRGVTYLCRSRALFACRKRSRLGEVGGPSPLCVYEK